MREKGRQVNVILSVSHYCECIKVQGMRFFSQPVFSNIFYFRVFFGGGANFFSPSYCCMICYDANLVLAIINTKIKSTKSCTFRKTYLGTLCNKYDVFLDWMISNNNRKPIESVWIRLSPQTLPNAQNIKKK